jgi:hypothetical protein
MKLPSVQCIQSVQLIVQAITRGRTWQGDGVPSVGFPRLLSNPIPCSLHCIEVCVLVWCELPTSLDRAKPVESILIPPEGINPVQHPPQPCFARPAGRWEVALGS